MDSKMFGFFQGSVFKKNSGSVGSVQKIKPSRPTQQAGLFEMPRIFDIEENISTADQMGDLSVIANSDLHCWHTPGLRWHWLVNPARISHADGKKERLFESWWFDDVFSLNGKFMMFQQHQNDVLLKKTEWTRAPYILLKGPNCINSHPTCTSSRSRPNVSAKILLRTVAEPGHIQLLIQ